MKVGWLGESWGKLGRREGRRGRRGRMAEEGRRKVRLDRREGKNKEEER